MPPAADAIAGADAPLLMPPEPPVDPSPGGPITAIEYEPVVLEYPPTTPLTSTGRWTVGTLTYTFGGLATVVILLLCGDFAFSMRERSVGPIVILMLNRLKASDTQMAFLFATLPTTLSLIISPIVSYRSDRYRSRWGRRIPFLLWPTPIAAASMIAMGYTEDFGPALQHLLNLPVSSQQSCALACFALLWTIFEVAAVVAGAVLNALINDVVPRAVLGRFYGMFRQVSLGAGIIFNSFIIGAAETHFKAIFISIGLLFFAGFTAMCLTVREGKYPPPPQTTTREGSRVWAATKAYFRECFHLKYYRRLFVGMTLAAAAFIPVNLFAILYAKQINVSLHTYGTLLSLSFFISFFMATPLGWVVDRAHTLPTTMATVAIYALLMILFGMTIHNALSFEIALVSHTVLSGCYWTVSPPLGLALFPRGNFAQFASAAGVVTSLFTIAFTPFLGRLLDMTHHEYRLTFLVAGAFGIAGLGTLMLVYRDFKRFGGPTAYAAPGES